MTNPNPNPNPNPNHRYDRQMSGGAIVLGEM